MAIGKNDDVAVCDYGNNRIQIFDAKGDCVTMYGASSAGVARVCKCVAVCCNAICGASTVGVASVHNVQCVAACCSVLQRESRRVVLPLQVVRVCTTVPCNAV